MTIKSRFGKSLAVLTLAAAAVALPSAASAAPLPSSGGLSLGVQASVDSRCVVKNVTQFVTVTNTGTKPVTVTASGEVSRVVTVAPGKTTSFVSNTRLSTYKGGEVLFSAVSADGSKGAFKLQAPARTC
jgi:hypothetical protein